VPLERILLRPARLMPGHGDGSAQPAAWRVLEGRPFSPQRRRLAVLSPCLPCPPADPGAAGTFHLLRQTASEFDVLLFAFAGGEEADCEPLLDFCARVVLVPRPGGGAPGRFTLRPPEVNANRSELMQVLWDALPRQLEAALRQVEGLAVASYGGDLLILDEPEGAAGARRDGWRWRWYERYVLRRFRRVVGAEDLPQSEAGWEALGRRRCALYHELIDLPVSVRRAAGSDIPDLDRIQRASPGAVLWEPHTYLSYDCLVAVIGRRVIGFVVCRALAEAEWEVLSLVVDPEVRRRGVGTRLMREVMGHQPGRWFLEVRESNSPARNLYKKLGFEDVATRADYYQDTGETAVVMRLESC